MSNRREQFIQVARSEAHPAPHGQVSDLVVDANGHRAGWKRLQQYFDEAVAGWSSTKWNEFGEIQLPSGKRRIRFLQGVQVPGFRVPQGVSKPSGVSWCGIFATWCLRQAGYEVQWHSGIGPRGANVTFVNQTTGFRVGDIIVIRGGEVHHAIVAELPSIYDETPTGARDTSIVTVNGNSLNQSIRIHSEYTLKDVAYYYSVPD
jgi:hypothetical protein